MKKVLLGIMLSLITFSMVGCMHVEQVIRVNEDGSGVMEFTNLILDGDNLSSSTLKTPEKEGLKLVKTEPYSIRKENGNYSGTKLYYSFDSVDSVIGDVVHKENSIVLKMDYKIDEITSDDSEDLSGFGELDDITEMLIDTMDYKFSIVVPSEIIYTNGKKVNSNTITWDMLKVEAGGQMIVEYAKEGSIETPAKLVSKEAKALEDLGILKGTDKGLELDSELSRIQGMVIYFRLLNPSITKTITNMTPFTDIPSWAVNEINYLYSNGLVKGISETELGSNNKMQVNDFTTLTLRALGYDDIKGDFEWSNSTAKAVNIGLLTNSKVAKMKESGRFTRDDMSHISYNTLALLKEGVKGELDNSIQPIKGDFIERGQPGTDKQKEFEKENGLEGWENWTEEEMEKDYEDNGFRVIGIY